MDNHELIRRAREALAQYLGDYSFRSTLKETRGARALSELDSDADHAFDLVTDEVVSFLHARARGVFPGPGPSPEGGLRR